MKDCQFCVSPVNYSDSVQCGENITFLDLPLNFPFTYMYLLAVLHFRIYNTYNFLIFERKKSKPENILMNENMVEQTGTVVKPRTFDRGVPSSKPQQGHLLLWPTSIHKTPCFLLFLSRCFYYKNVEMHI